MGHILTILGCLFSCCYVYNYNIFKFSGKPNIGLKTILNKNIRTEKQYGYLNLLIFNFQ